MPWLFMLFLAVHVAAGTVALISVWAAVLSRKGGDGHRYWGRLFTGAIYWAAAMALGMGALSLRWLLAMHEGLTDAALYRGLLGWMMLYLGLLTITFADYGLTVARARQNRVVLRGPRMTLIFALTGLAAINCAAQGWRLGQPLMMLVAAIGLTAMSTQLAHIWRARPGPRAHVAEHFRALIGMGISAYTAFLSVGLIRLVPDHVFNPVIWAVPSIVGVALIARFSATGARAPVSPARAR